MFDYHRKKGYPDLYSLHSWCGLLVFVLYCVQVSQGGAQAESDSALGTEMRSCHGTPVTTLKTGWSQDCTGTPWMPQGGAHVGFWLGLQGTHPLLMLWGTSSLEEETSGRGLPGCQ